MMFLGKLVIDIMCGDDGKYCRRQQIQFPFVPYLFGKQETDANREDKHRQKPVVASLIAMGQGKDAYNKGQGYHAIFKGKVMYYVDAKQW